MHTFGVMALQRRLLLILTIMIPLLLFISLKPVFTGSLPVPAQPGRQMSVNSKSDYPGSSYYSWQLRLISVKEGDRAVLRKIMDDILGNPGQIDRNSYEENLRLYRTVSYYVNKLGDIDREIHYFRNELNRCPKTLEDLLLQNGRLPEKRRWKLVSVKGSLYHMQGPDGIYNLKFISPDGFCEAVYNKAGVLLTEANDPVNMGTFNYSPGINHNNAHKKFDVLPYLKWGNSANSPQRSYEEIRKGTNEAAMSYNRNSARVTNYRENLQKKRSRSS